MTAPTDTATPENSAAVSGSDQHLVGPCPFCGFIFEIEECGIYGCPNCHGEGLEDETAENAPSKKFRKIRPRATKARSPETAGIRPKPKNGKTRYDIMAAMKVIEQIWKDSDGWWAILKDGWTIDGASGVREDTKKALIARVKSEARRARES